METEHGAFEVPDFWRKSAFSLPDAPEQTLFSDLQLDLPVIAHDLSRELGLPDIDSFEFGQLEDIGPPEPPKAEESVSDDRISEASTHDDELWRLDLSQPERGSLRTWEAFTHDQHEEPPIACISEAGPRAFDALQDDDTSVLQSAFTTKCLALLGLGRSSALFQWNEDDDKFAPTLNDVRLSGFTKVAYDSLVKHLSTVGTAFADLRHFVNTAYTAKHPLAARVALATSIQVVLEALDQALAQRVLAAPSTLQLLAEFDLPGHLLTELQGFVRATAHADMDVAYLSAVRDKVEELAEACSPFRSVHTEILNVVSRPWIQRVCRSTGLVHGQLDSSEHEEPLYPAGLVSDEDIIRIGEITTGFAILKHATPDHPLLVPASWHVEQPELDLSSVQAHADRIVEKANEYQRHLLSAISSYDKGVARHQPVMEIDNAEHLVSEHLPWQLDEGQQHYFELVGNKLSEPPSQAADASNLRASVSAVLQTNLSDHEDHLILENDTSTPLQYLEPYLLAQSRLVNGSIIRLLFRRFHLRKHLNLQHSFHLFGNGLFVQRLTNALFSSSANSAERSRGRVPNTINLGLRLDSRSAQKWPPASSELRLGLMGVLTDAWGSSKDLPGGLSFAIRELSEAEIEKVLDPHSIHALDFLRLKYDAPPPLDVVLTEDTMRKYDDCFRVLLNVLRMLHVSTLLRRGATTDSDTMTPAMQAFAHDAQHVVTAISSYFFDCGVGVSWRDFNSRLDALEADLATEDKDEEGYGFRVRIGLEGLRKMHNDMLEEMRARLLLRTRHARLRLSVDEIFSTVLAVQKLVIESNGRPHDKNIWKQRKRLKQQVDGLLTGLKDLGRKLVKRTASEQDAEDAAAAEMLSLKLGFAVGNEVDVLL